MDVRSSIKTGWLKNSPSNCQPNQVCTKSIDSGVGSFEEGDSTEAKDSIMTSAAENLHPADELLQNGEGASQRFQFVYLGFAVLDRRYTQSMLPWVISEVRRRKERNDIHLCVEGSSVKALNVADGTITFQHGVQTITRCARSLDKKCFAYLVKSNDNTCSCFCYVFESVDNLSVRFLPVILLFKSCCCFFFFLSNLTMLTIYLVFLLPRDMGYLLTFRFVNG